MHKNSIATSRSFKFVTADLTDKQRLALADLIDDTDAGTSCWNLVERFTVTRTIPEACAFAAQHQTDASILACLKRFAEVAAPSLPETTAPAASIESALNGLIEAASLYHPTPSPAGSFEIALDGLVENARADLEKLEADNNDEGEYLAEYLDRVRETGQFHPVPKRYTYEQICSGIGLVRVSARAMADLPGTFQRQLSGSAGSLSISFHNYTLVVKGPA
jgi:hypothetical protein